MKARKTAVSVTFYGVLLNVTGLYSASTPDVFYLRNGDPGHPGDPAEFEVDQVFVDSGIPEVLIDITEWWTMLPDKLSEELVALCLENVTDDEEF